MELDEIDEILFDFKQKLQKFEESQGDFLFKKSSYNFVLFKPKKLRKNRKKLD